MTQRIDKLLSLYNNDKENEFLLFAIAKEYYKIDDYENSISFFDILLNKNKSYTGMYYHYALALRANGKNDLARQIIVDGIHECMIASQLHDRNELISLLESE